MCIGVTGGGETGEQGERRAVVEIYLHAVEILSTESQEHVKDVSPRQVLRPLEATPPSPVASPGSPRAQWEAPRRPLLPRSRTTH